jgi:hypothetical protein
MIKRGIAILMTAIIVMNSGSISFAATGTRLQKEGILGTANAGEIISEEEQKKIDALYAQRLKLCVNYEKNKKEIEKLDKKIERLGAVEISSKDVEEKMKITVDKEGTVFSEQSSINVKVPKESYVKWTSTKRIVTYNGVQYEIQELRAVPISSRGSLYGSATVKETKRQNIKATTEFIKSIVPTVMGMMPKGVGALGNGISIYQACKSYNKNLSSSVTVENIEANSTITVGTDYVFDYVKKAGYKDEGHQVLCYAGNNVNTEITTVIPTLEFEKKKNEYKVKQITRHDTQTLSSPKINNRYNTACSNYVKYSKGKNMNSHYNIQKFQIRLLSKTKKTVWVPKPNYGF